MWKQKELRRTSPTVKRGSKETTEFKKWTHEVKRSGFYYQSGWGNNCFFRHNITNRGMIAKMVFAPDGSWTYEEVRRYPK